MPYKAKPGETEFGGVPGMFPAEQRAYPSLQQEMWSIEATNEGGGPDADGRDTASVEWGADNIGEPKQSFTAEADLSEEDE